VLKWFSADAFMQKQPSAVLGNTAFSDLHLSATASSTLLPQMVNLPQMQQRRKKEASSAEGIAIDASNSDELIESNSGKHSFLLFFLTFLFVCFFMISYDRVPTPKS